MKNSILTSAITILSLTAFSQTIVEKRLPANSGDEVSLDIQFANEVTVFTWDKREVMLSASISIEKGEKDDLYEIEAISNGNTLNFRSNGEELAKNWSTIYSSEDCCHNHGTHMEINIKVYMPADLDLSFNSISGNIEVATLTDF